MSYQVLARKWRPAKFEQVVGQSHVLHALTNALTQQRLHHAYLFSGTRGVGKTSLARLFAKGLNCEQGVSAQPCGLCASCVEIAQGRFVDLIEVDAASRTKVDDTRELLDNVQYRPSRGRYKVYLIDEVHMLSRSSFNALLKTLEEPPEHVKFLLATTDPQKLPITVLSRCLQFNLKSIAHEDIVTQLTHVLSQETIHFEEQALTLIAKSANGSMRDALSLTDQAIAFGAGQVMLSQVQTMLGSIDEHHVIHLLKALMSGDIGQLMQVVHEVLSFGADADEVLRSLLELLHQITLTQFAPAAAQLSLNSEQILTFSHELNAEQVQLYYQILLTGRKDLIHAPDPKSGLEMALLRAVTFVPETPITRWKNDNTPSDDKGPSVADRVKPDSTQATSSNASNLRHANALSVQQDRPESDEESASSDHMPAELHAEMALIMSQANAQGVNVEPVAVESIAVEVMGNAVIEQAQGVNVEPSAIGSMLDEAMNNAAIVQAQGVNVEPVTVESIADEAMNNAAIVQAQGVNVETVAVESIADETVNNAAIVQAQGVNVEPVTVESIADEAMNNAAIVQAQGVNVEPSAIGSMLDDGVFSVPESSDGTGELEAEMTGIIQAQEAMMSEDTPQKIPPLASIDAGQSLSVGDEPVSKPVIEDDILDAVLAARDSLLAPVDEDKDGNETGKKPSIVNHRLTNPVQERVTPYDDLVDVTMAKQNSEVVTQRLEEDRPPWESAPADAISSPELLHQEIDPAEQAIPSQQAHRQEGLDKLDSSPAVEDELPTSTPASKPLQIPLSGDHRDLLWYKFMASLEVGGRVRQLAVNSVCLQFGQMIHLKLKPDQKHLCADIAIDQLETAISQSVDKMVQLSVEVGLDPSRETPLEVRKRFHQELLNDAAQTLEQDENIQWLMHNMQGQIQHDTLAYAPPLLTEKSNDIALLTIEGFDKLIVA
ncbi:DNA polymerase III subunit gamma/tau [uncultured Shewanella sp.]|uniref:DNA polymerase III subunit gamma/tau n=1 Tax=uncultured Shewanella sp. TaxID=173975 RepID=UPI00260A31FB|nr:DNA polymerase III subunit gamma/tau [uncultured Shewanella sp.]